LRFLAEAGAIFAKEWLTEWRTRVALSGTALFTVCALTLIALSLRVGAAARVDAPVVAGLLWIVLLFTAATGLGRSFVQEEERGTSLALRLTARATAVWTGKFASNVVLLMGLTIVAAPILMTLLAVGSANYWLLICVLTLGDLGIAAVFTMTSALIAQSSSRGGLLSALSFPLLVPLLMAGVHGTQAAFGVGTSSGSGIEFASGVGDLRVLSSYAVVAITASLLLFDYVWSD
jgi:heme exporter protein B